MNNNNNDNNTQTLWTTDTLNIYLSKIMDERDRAYQQRWEAQEKAVAAALIAQEKSVATAFNAQEKAVASALSAAERAVSKAETASEKRFDTINEKIESNNTILDKFESNTKSLVGRIDDLREYKDTASGKATGLHSGWVYLLGSISALSVILNIIMTFKH